MRDPAYATTAASAATQAATAAERAGVQVGELLDLDAIASAAELYRTVWQTDTRSAPVSPDLMRALSHAGGYVAGAYDGSRLVAASMAFHTGGAEAGLHSHISAVAANVQGRQVGLALKLHQRAWALDRGISTISWTYDPLLRRNAWFNLTKLGARAVGYLTDFYGVMEDAQNAGDESDRAVALWSLTADHVRRAADGDRSERTEKSLLAEGAELALCERDGGPELLPLTAGVRTVLVQIPPDIQALRRHDLHLAREWRRLSRSVLEPMLAGSFVATGFTRSGCYVLEEIAE